MDQENSLQEEAFTNYLGNEMDKLSKMKLKLSQKSQMNMDQESSIYNIEV